MRPCGGYRGVDCLRPNNPAAGTFKVVVNCDDVVTGVVPAHPWLLNGFKAVALYIETAL